MTKEKDPGKAILELVDKLHEERKIPRETIFSGIESAIQVAAERHFGVEEGVLVNIDQATGHIVARYGEKELDPETLGRIAAQSAKQMIIQKIREAESDTVFNEFAGKKGELVVGTVTRVDAGTAIVSLGKSEALLPRSEQIPGEIAPRRRAREGRHPRRPQAGPSRQDRAVAVPPGLRAGALRGRNPRDRRPHHRHPRRRPRGRLSLEGRGHLHRPEGGLRRRVRRRSRQPHQERDRGTQRRAHRHRPLERRAAGAHPERAAAGADLAKCSPTRGSGRAIVLVTDDQLSLAIGRRGQNVRLASKLVGLGHRDHDARRTGRGAGAGRAVVRAAAARQRGTDQRAHRGRVPLVQRHHLHRRRRGWPSSPGCPRSSRTRW